LSTLRTTAATATIAQSSLRRFELLIAEPVVAEPADPNLGDHLVGPTDVSR